MDINEFLKDFVGNFKQVNDVNLYLKLCSELQNHTDIIPVQRIIINDTIKNFHHAGIEYNYENSSNLLSRLDCLSIGPFPHIFIEPMCDSSNIVSSCDGKYCTDIAAVVEYLTFIVSVYDKSNMLAPMTLDGHKFMKLLLGISTKMSDSKIPTINTYMDNLGYRNDNGPIGIPNNGINNVKLLLGFTKN